MRTRRRRAAPSLSPAKDAHENTNVACLFHRHGRRWSQKKGRLPRAARCALKASDANGKSKCFRALCPRYRRRERQESEQLHRALATDGEGRRRKHERCAPAPFARTARAPEERATAALRALAAVGEGHQRVEPPPRAALSPRTARDARESRNCWEPAPSPPTARDVDDYSPAARARDPAGGCKLRFQGAGAVSLQRGRRGGRPSKMEGHG